MQQRVLMPVDFGGCSRQSLSFARKLCLEGSVIRFLYVVDDHLTLPFAGMLDFEKVEIKAQQALEKLAAEQGTGLVKFETALRHGTVESEIIEEAKQWEADAILLGSHGRKGLRRFLIGSVAESVVRSTDRPCYVVKTAGREASKLECIAFATDFSEASAPAFELFRELLLAHAAKGQLIHVFDTHAWGMYESHGMQSMISASDEGEFGRRERQELLDKSLETLTALGLSVTPVMLEGLPWQKISTHVQHEEMDLLILGTHGYLGVERLLIGSVAEKTLRSADCPVAIVPSLCED